VARIYDICDWGSNQRIYNFTLYSVWGLYVADNKAGVCSHSIVYSRFILRKLTFPDPPGSQLNKRGNVPINVTLRRVRITIVAVENE
jgi:hypothetical protein